MAYTPELSYENSCTLRRIAWAFGLPMTKAMNSKVFEFVVKHVDREQVCSYCRDKSKCEECRFNSREVSEGIGVY